MWLPETAVDEETLDVLASEHIRFTVLGPAQVRRVPAWGRAGRWRGASGHELAIFVYDGPSAHDVAFGDALDDAGRWAERLTAFALAPDTGPTIVSLATDGETFGHHHRFGDMTLASLCERLSQRDDVAMTNYAAVLALSDPTDDVTVVSPSSWSCPHGVRRWQDECGCRFDADTSQAWRAPLREAMLTLASGVTASMQAHWPPSAGDLWAARDRGGPDLAGVAELPAAARQLLEAGQHALAMFTSCAWFFDDLGRLEPLIVLRHAARALDLLPPADGATLEVPLLETLARAQSDDPAKGDGATIWRRDVVPASRGPAQLAAGLAALRELAPDALLDVRMPAHDWRIEGDDLVLRHRRTDRTCRWHAEPVTLGVFSTRVHVRRVPASGADVVAIAAFPDEIKKTIRTVAAPMILEAALSADDAAALAAGLLELENVRARALRGAWALIDRDGLDDAGIVMHGVLDLHALDDVVLDDVVRAEALTRLREHSPSHMRDSLAERFGVTP